MRRTKLSLIIPVFVSAVLLGGCIALKPNGKISYVKQVYHDITHRNNGYFNAEQRVEKVQNSIVATRKDDYDKILSIYTDRDPDAAKAYTSDLDEVIKKASTVIQNHGPSIYTPNSYFLVGVAYFLKADYENAQITFQFVNTEFKKKPQSGKKAKSDRQKMLEKEKKKKKKKGGKPQAAQPAAAEKAAPAKSSKSNSKRPMTALQKQEQEQEQREEDSLKKMEESKQVITNATVKTKTDTTTKAAAATVEQNKGGEDWWHWLKHEPIRPDAMIWLTDTYTAMKKFKEAEAVLTIIDADQNFPAWLKKDVELARTNLYLKKGDYGRAIPSLSWLIEHTKRKHGRVRYEYILAQIYERQKNSGEAIIHYKNALDGGPSYQMAFNAKMSFARIAVKDNTMPTEEVIKLLKKLLNDSKNKEFYDQVYFALAELTLRDGNRSQAITYYKKCIETSTSNTAQKSKAYLRLGELYYDEENYVLSQPYYDSSLTLLPKDDPKRSEVAKRASVLKNLVTQVNIIHDGDSLLKLSTMTERERDEYVDEQLKKKDEEKAKKEQEQKFLQQQNQPAANTPNDPNSWYFDNANAKSTGYNDFVKRWGQRELDDNWRRVDKSVLSNEDKSKETEDTAAIAAEKAAGKQKLTEKEKLLKNIPAGDADVKKANDKIADAYYTLGNIYSIELNNIPKAIATFEELLRKYAENKWQGATYYNLYLLYAKQGNTEKADYYKNLVLAKFPDSKYAGIIRDPDYLKHESQAASAANRFYEGTYQFYQQGVYDSVISRVAVADSTYKDKDDKLRPRFDLLQAFAIGKTKDLRSYKDALKAVSKQYPNDPVHLKAEEILKVIENTKDSVVRIQNNMTRYEFSVEARHFFLVVIKGDSIKAPEVVKKIADYNLAKDTSNKLKIEPMALPDGNTIFSVKSFDNLQKGKDYYDAFTQSNVLGAMPQKVSYYLISDVNMNKVIINKEIGSYFDFYNTKYPK